MHRRLVSPRPYSSLSTLSVSFSLSHMILPPRSLAPTTGTPPPSVAKHGDDSTAAHLSLMSHPHRPEISNSSLLGLTKSSIEQQQVGQNVARSTMGDVGMKPEMGISTLFARFVLSCNYISHLFFITGKASVTKWAIEYEEPVGAAFKPNHPDALAFVHNCNVILSHAHKLLKFGRAWGRLFLRWMRWLRFFAHTRNRISRCPGKGRGSTVPVVAGLSSEGGGF